MPRHGSSLHLPLFWWRYQALIVDKRVRVADASDEVNAHQGSEGANKVALRRTDPNLHLCHELSRPQASSDRAPTEREIDKKWLKVQSLFTDTKMRKKQIYQSEPCSLLIGWNIKTNE